MGGHTGGLNGHYTTVESHGAGSNAVTRIYSTLIPVTFTTFAHFAISS